MQQPCCVYTTWLLFAVVVGFCFAFALFLLRLLLALLLLLFATVVGFCFVFVAVAVGFCFVFAAIFLWLLLRVWSMHPEIALCFFQDDISGPHAS